MNLTANEAINIFEIILGIIMIPFFGINALKLHKKIQENKDRFGSKTENIVNTIGIFMCLFVIFALIMALLYKMNILK